MYSLQTNRSPPYAFRLELTRRHNAIQGYKWLSDDLRIDERCRPGKKIYFIVIDLNATFVKHFYERLSRTDLDCFLDLAAKAIIARIKRAPSKDFIGFTMVRECVELELKSLITAVFGKIAASSLALDYIRSKHSFTIFPNPDRMCTRFPGLVHADSKPVNWITNSFAIIGANKLISILRSTSVLPAMGKSFGNVAGSLPLTADMLNYYEADRRLSLNCDPVLGRAPALVQTLPWLRDLADLHAGKVYRSLHPALLNFLSAENIQQYVDLKLGLEGKVNKKDTWATLEHDNHVRNLALGHRTRENYASVITTACICETDLVPLPQQLIPSTETSRYHVPSSHKRNEADAVFSDEYSSSSDETEASSDSELSCVDSNSDSISTSSSEDYISDSIEDNLTSRRHSKDCGYAAEDKCYRKFYDDFLSTGLNDRFCEDLLSSQSKVKCRLASLLSASDELQNYYYQCSRQLSSLEHKTQEYSKPLTERMQSTLESRTGFVEPLDESTDIDSKDLKPAGDLIAYVRDLAHRKLSKINEQDMEAGSSQNFGLLKGRFDESALIAVAVIIEELTTEMMLSWKKRHLDACKALSVESSGKGTDQTPIAADIDPSLTISRSSVKAGPLEFSVKALEVELGLQLKGSAADLITPNDLRAILEALFCKNLADFVPLITRTLKEFQGRQRIENVKAHPHLDEWYEASPNRPDFGLYSGEPNLQFSYGFMPNRFPGVVHWDNPDVVGTRCELDRLNAECPKSVPEDVRPYLQNYAIRKYNHDRGRKRQKTTDSTYADVD